MTIAPGTTRGVAIAPFGTTPAGERVDAYTLTNARGASVRFLTYGGVIACVCVPDRAGALADVVLGHDALEDYVADPHYFGAIIGRYANRLARGRFVVNGREHRVAANDGAHHLHGGTNGFHRAVWSAEPFEDAARGRVGAVLHHVSPDGDEGYPGTLAVRVTYAFGDDDALVVDYHAESDRDTPVNLTQHAYFNLAGHDAGDVLAHELTLCASRFTPVDEELIPTGEIRSVAHTPFDFTRPIPIGARLDADDPQLAAADGYDHNFVLDRQGHALALAARLVDPASGRTLEVHTTEPGLHVYSGNALGTGPLGKGGHAYGRHAGIALETQHFPNSPNQAGFPSTILRAGETYRSRSVYRFGVAS